jgi:hypothetical protein
MYVQALWSLLMVSDIDSQRIHVEIALAYGRPGTP